MIDPMANLDGGAPGAEADEKDVIDVTSLRYNLERVDKIRSVMGIASGCVAGVCGLTGLEGLGTFALPTCKVCCRSIDAHMNTRLLLFYSMLRRLAFPCTSSDVESEDGVQALPLYKTKLVVICNF
jgi:hypothetical protein